VFWCFFLLTGLSLFVLRGRARNVVSRAQTQKSVPRGQAPDAPRAYRVPLYPLTPALFCCTCAYLLYASVMHTGIGALVGIAMLACGMPVLWLMRRRRRARGYWFKTILQGKSNALQNAIDGGGLLRLQPSENGAERVLDSSHANSSPMVNKMLELAEVQRDHLVYDLGSGDGRIFITAAKKYGARGSHRHRPQRIREARKNARAAGVTDLVQFRQADLFETDFSPATVVTLYLLPSLNDLLRPKLLQQLQSRTLIVSHTFEITG
jgi:hypothetical protein